MPNRYLPSALCDIIEERHEQALRNSDDESYIPEHEILVDMLKPEVQRELENRMTEEP